MALQSSGAISLANVQTEFGGSNPISISEYYGADSGVPGSGIISLSDFYGTSAQAPDSYHTFIDTTSPGIQVLSGTLGTSGCDYWMYNSQRQSGINVSAFGVNTVGPNYPLWAGGSGGTVNNAAGPWIMVETNQDPNDWAYFELDGGVNRWTVISPGWSNVGSNLFYLTGGTALTTGTVANNNPGISGSGSMASVWLTYFNGDPTFINLGADLNFTQT